MSLRILIADDSLFWRDQFRAIFRQDSDWTVYEARNGDEAVQKSTWIKPDVAILDYRMPVLDGLSAARELKQAMPKLSILIVTVDKTRFLEVAARQAGVLAVFSKMECLEARDFLRQRLQAQAG